jgi:uncharacterized membrane protein (UPF0127 family)
MAVFSAQGKAFNRTRQAYLATALAVADTHWTRLRGLLGLGPDDFRNGYGLWILPCHGVHTLGMQFPLDVVYLDPSLTVIHIERNLRPWRFAPVRMQAASVLELPARTADETQTIVGDKIEIIINEQTVSERAVADRVIEPQLIEAAPAEKNGTVSQA